MGAKQYAYVNCDMLKWARGETPFASIHSVIERVKDFTHEKLQAWESGEEFPSITEAKKLATIYDVPFACFYFSSIPTKKIRPYTDRRILFGSQPGTISYELWHEIRRLQSNRESALEIVTNIASIYPLIPSISSGDDVRIVAKKIRDFIGLNSPFPYKSVYGNNAFNYFRRLFENKGIMVAQISGVEITEIRGLSLSYDNLPIIGVNAKDWERSKVFTLFHEMVHLLRHSSSLCMIDFDDRNDDEEKICDRIAAEALLPEPNFRAVATNVKLNYVDWDYNCLVSIADKYAVSILVVLRRLYETGVISKSQYINRYEELEKEFLENREIIEKKREKNSIVVEYFYRYLNQQGYLYPKIVLSAYANGVITYGEMCCTLNVNPIHIANIEQAVMFK